MKNQYLTYSAIVLLASMIHSSNARADLHDLPYEQLKEHLEGMEMYPCGTTVQSANLTAPGVCTLEIESHFCNDNGDKTSTTTKQIFNDIDYNEHYCQIKGWDEQEQYNNFQVPPKIHQPYAPIPDPVKWY